MEGRSGVNEETGVFYVLGGGEKERSDSDGMRFLKERDC